MYITEYKRSQLINTSTNNIQISFTKDNSRGLTTHEHWSIIKDGSEIANGMTPIGASTIDHDLAQYGTFEVSVYMADASHTQIGDVKTATITVSEPTFDLTTSTSDLTTTFSLTNISKSNCRIVLYHNIKGASGSALIEITADTGLETTYTFDRTETTYDIYEYLVYVYDTTNNSTFNDIEIN